MTPKRAAAYLVLASLLIAWLASASGVSRSPIDQQPQPEPVRTSGTETLASDVEAQAVRLKERLAAAPAPQDPARNPFDFLRRQTPPARALSQAPTTPVSDDQIQAVPREPVLSLIGIAEDDSPAGPLRTAIITAGGGEVFVVKTGDILGRYKVGVVGVDTVELVDLATGASRRLALR